MGLKMPDFSKEGMQQFFLLHTEKLILGVCLVLFGVFLWMGLQNKPYTAKDPSSLLSVAQQANAYINNPSSWEKMAEFRTGQANVEEIITGRVDVKGSDYMTSAFRGTAAATKAPRIDPEILKPEKMVASVFPAVFLFNNNAASPLDDLLPAPGEVVAAAGTGGGDSDGFGFDAGDDGEDPGDVPGGGDLGASLGQDRNSKKPKEDPDAVEPPVLEYARNQMFEVNEATIDGVRPTVTGISAQKTKAKSFDVVAVRGLIDFKKQSAIFKEALSDSIGYYPERDRPIYQFLEVQRREVDAAGKPLGNDRGKWADISEFVSFRIPRVYPRMHSMPQSIYFSAPEVIAPEYFDPVLTQPIPPLALTDYRPYVGHPELEKRREFPEYDEGGVEVKKIDNDTNIDDDIFGESSTRSSGAGGTGRPGGKFSGMSGGAGMGMGMGASGPSEGAGGGPSGQPGGGGAGGGGFGGPTVDPDNDNYLRKGSVVEPYAEALEAKVPAENYRLIRFFDLRAERGVRYQYRVRLWLGDPNNEDPSMQFVNERMGGLAVEGGGSGDREGDLAGGMDPGLFGGKDDPSGDDPGDKPQEEDETYVKQTITSSMLRPEVRKRINAAKSKDGVYYISTDADATQMIPVPRPTDKGLNYDKYVRYCRPSEWSEPVQVEVKVDTTEVYAGKTVRSRKIKVQNDLSFEETEPAIEVVTSTLSDVFGTRVPAMKQFYRGDGLDFFSPAYVLHPISRQVLVAQNPRFNGPGRYQFEFRTDNVLVDSIFGEELPLPRTEKKRYSTPTELLVMDANGDFHISNEMNDMRHYRNSLFLPDESKYVGKERKKRTSNKDNGRGAGAGGKFGSGAGGAGGADGDFGG